VRTRAAGSMRSIGSQPFPACGRLAAMLRRRARITLLTSILALAAAIGARGVVALESGWVPKLSGWVNDTAGVLTQAQQERLASTLEKYQQETQETHHQIAILIVPSLGEESIETFSLRTANAWGLGNKGFDDGILVTLAMKERTARIELGTGIQRFISDADAKRIIDTEMTPLFSNGDISGGLERGVERLMEQGRRFIVEIARAP
jgi:uncharacterized protein